jgi:hypothetical protein
MCCQFITCFFTCHLCIVVLLSCTLGLNTNILLFIACGYVIYLMWFWILSIMDFSYFVVKVWCVCWAHHGALCTLRCQCLDLVNYKILGPICQRCICFMLWICHVFPCQLNVRSIILLHMISIAYKVDCLVSWVFQMFFCWSIKVKC